MWCNATRLQHSSVPSLFGSTSDHCSGSHHGAVFQPDKVFFARRKAPSKKGAIAPPDGKLAASVFLYVPHYFFPSSQRRSLDSFPCTFPQPVRPPVPIINVVNRYELGSTSQSTSGWFAWRIVPRRWSRAVFKVRKWSLTSWTLRSASSFDAYSPGCECSGTATWSTQFRCRALRGPHRIRRLVHLRLRGPCGTK